MKVAMEKICLVVVLIGLLTLFCDNYIVYAAPDKEDSIEAENANAKIKATSSDELDKFIQKTSFMETDSRYDSFLEQYKWDAIKVAYFNYNVTATEKEWDNLTPYESFCFYYCYMLPYGVIVERGMTTETDCISQLKAVKILLDAADKSSGELVYSACEDVMLYLLNSFNQNGYFEDLYGIEKLEDQVTETITKVDDSNIESTTASEEPNIPSNTVNEESVPALETSSSNTNNTTNIKGVKDNAVTVVILLVLAGILAGVIIYRKQKALNKDK